MICRFISTSEGFILIDGCVRFATSYPELEWFDSFHKIIDKIMSDLKVSMMDPRC